MMILIHKGCYSNPLIPYSPLNKGHITATLISFAY